jgi:hypothetical protein
MERRRCYVLGVLVASAFGLLASGCGNKKEDSTAMGADAPAATLSADTTPPPVLSVPPPLPVPTVAATPARSATPAPAKSAEKADPEAEAKGVNSCCAALRIEASKAKGDDKAKYQRGAQTCSQLRDLVRSGGSTKDRALGSVRAAISGQKVPPSCELAREVG